MLRAAFHSRVNSLGANFTLFLVGAVPCLCAHRTDRLLPSNLFGLSPIGQAVPLLNQQESCIFPFRQRERIGNAREQAANRCHCPA